jgi:DNA polymerase I-like protein with 3'-5' exonuclease and polymerase domains
MERFPNELSDLMMNANNRISQQTFATVQFIDELVATGKRVNLILKDMEEGFQVDVRTLTDLKRSYESVLFSLQKEIRHKLGRSVRVNSNRELGDLFFDTLRLPSPKRTPTGNPSVSIDVLERLGDSHSSVYPIR